MERDDRLGREMARFLRDWSRRDFLRRTGQAGVVLATTSGLTALVDACTGSSSSTSSTEADLTILDHQKPRVDLLTKLLPQFEKDMKAQGKNIKVKLLEGPAEDTQFQTKVTLDYNSKNAADVISYGASMVPDFSGSGFLLDLTPYVNKWPDFQHFYPKIRDQLKGSDSKVYSVSREASVIELFYRKDVLDAHGISTAQPATWQDLLDRMVQAKNAIGSPSLLFPAGSAWGGGTFDEGFLHVMLGTSSPLYDMATNKWVVRSAGLTQAFDFYQAMTKDGLLPVQQLLNPEPWVATKYKAFPDGKLICTTSGTWGWFFDWGPGGTAPIPDLHQKVATWDFPTADGSAPFVTGSAGWVWTISAQTKHSAAAWELVKWLAGGTFMASNAVTIGAVAPRDDLHNVAPYSNYPFLISAEEQLKTAHTFRAEAGQAQFVQAVGVATDGIITGKMTGAQAAQVFAQRATQLLGDKLVEAK